MSSKKITYFGKNTIMLSSGIVYYIDYLSLISFFNAEMKDATKNYSEKLKNTFSISTNKLIVPD
jgi:hypothetical protein